ncbi:MAG: type VI secretion system baseplate subunit TssE [Thalassobaculaceae bacterium]|nr:type VI secretion system baseplate subunit TssE [Thalassobaculaceae bacterium]
MFEQTLFQRLLDPQPARSTTSFDSARQMDSVLLHLREIFNVRSGAVPTRPDYGLPDFNDLVIQFPSAVPAISRSIKQQIEMFEPRLRRVTVRHVPDPDRPLSLFFNIAAEMVMPDGQERVAFETVLGADGSVSVR